LIYLKVKIFKLCLILLFGGAFLFYYYTFDPSVQTGNFISCPTNKFLGFFCPGCGSQRMIHHLLHLEFYHAFRYNPLLFVFFPFILYCIYLFIANTFFGANYRMKILYKNWFVWTFFGLVLVYAILRNLPFHPFNLLAPPY
jgi:hypothetical protein